MAKDPHESVRGRVRLDRAAARDCAPRCKARVMSAVHLSAPQWPSKRTPLPNAREFGVTFTRELSAGHYRKFCQHRRHLASYAREVTSMKTSFQIMPLLAISIIVTLSSYAAADNCGSCGTVCTLRAPGGHCITHGHDITCEARKRICLTNWNKVVGCVNGVIKTAGVTAACGGCVAGTSGAGLAACIGPCAADIGTVQSAQQQCR
jgi:hypothetical protein